MGLSRFTGSQRYMGAGRNSSFGSMPRLRQSGSVSRPMIAGGSRGMKKLIATATGKSYASQEIEKNFKLFQQAVKSGQEAFIDTHGKVHDISTPSKQQVYMAKRIGSGTADVTSKEGIQKITRGFVATARELGIKLREGQNIGSVGDAAKKLQGELAPKDTGSHQQALVERQQRLATLHAAIHRPEVQSPATPAHTAIPTLQTPTPLTATTTAPRSSMAPFASGSSTTIHVPGAHGAVTSPVTSIGIPQVIHREAVATPAATMQRTVEPTVTSPAISEPLPPHPVVPDAEAMSTRVAE